MSGKCEICEKTTTFGRHIRYNHGGSWERRAQKKSRTFKPNLQVTTIYVGGVARQARICTRCLRSLYKTKG